jgi:hypothetical protein
MAFDRKKYSEDLAKRAKDSYDRKDQGFFGGSIFQPGAELPMWKCKEGKHYVDIIPYLAGKNDPLVKEGKASHCLEIWVHYGVGPNDLPFICLLKNYNESCPVCDQREAFKASGEVDEEVLKDLTPKRRTIYNIICYDDRREEDKGIQIWDVSHFFFEKNVASIAHNPRIGGTITWFDPDKGKQIMFERRGSGANNTSFIGHALMERDYVISDELLEDAFCLDELIHVPTYEEVELALKGRAGADRAREDRGHRQAPSEEERPSRRAREEEERPSRRARAEEEERPTRRAREEEERPSRRAREEEERPSRRAREDEGKKEGQSAGRRRDPEPEPEKDPPFECPGDFGKDTDKFDQCVKDCPDYDKCADEYERREKEEKERKAGKKAGGGRLRR